MPPLKLGGRSFLVSPDDLVFAAAPSSLLHVFWILLDTSNFSHQACKRLEIDPDFLELDAGVCLIILLLDVLIAITSARGVIMARRKHPRLLVCLLWPRLLLSVPLFAIYMYVAIYGMFDFLNSNFGTPDPFGKANLLNRTDVPGWGPSLSQQHWLPMLVAQLLVLVRVLITLPGAMIFITTIIPREVYAETSLIGIRRALQVVGVGDDMMQGIIKVLLEVMGQGTMELATPSDLAFGLLLVAGHQRQGVLGWEACPKGDTLSPSTKRATILTGVNHSPVPLSEDSVTDRKSLRDVVHYVPYAIGVYGISMVFLSKAVYPMSTVPSPFRTCLALCQICKRKKVPHPPLGKVMGDICFRLNERALRQVVSEATESAGIGTQPELLWATWRNRGPGTAPPLAVFLDFHRQKLVIVVRGTLDIKDCVSDLGADPTFFDPLGLAGESEARQAPFDDQKDLFAHSVIVSCAKDAEQVLIENGVFEAALGPNGAARGWGIVCVGHSLGAGVACLLALILRGGCTYTRDVSHIGFEPPGGLLSKRLSDKTGKLGFISAVCANDWISRLSIRGVQELREQTLDELEQCDRSKVQLVALMCSCVLRRHLPRCCGLAARIFEKLGGGPLHVSNDAPVRRGPSSLRMKNRFEELTRFMQAPGAGEKIDLHRQDSTESVIRLFAELWPPSPCLYFRPQAHEFWFFGCYEVATNWMAEWVKPEDLHEIIISPRSVELHFPNILKRAYTSAAINLGAVEYGDGADTDDFGSSTSSDDMEESALMRREKSND